MLLDFVPRNTFLHRLHVVTKLAGFSALVILCFAIKHPFYNVVLLFLCIAAGVSCAMPLVKLADFLRPLLPVFILMLILSAFSYRASDFSSEAARAPLFTINEFPVLTGSMLRGCNLILRIMIMVLASTVLTFTTPVEAFLLVLKRLRFPHEISFIIATGIRFMPTLERKSRMVFDAQRARGVSLEDSRVFGRIRAYATIMVPLLVEAIRMADNLALAMVNRGFGAVKNRTELAECVMAPADYVLSMVFVVAATAGVVVWMLDLAGI